MALPHLRLDPEILDEVEDYFAHMPEGQVDINLNELELLTVGNIDDKNYRFFKAFMCRL